MSEKLNNPHDKFFKAYFGRPEVALDLVQNYLPPDVVTLFDLSTLRIEPDGFIDEALQEYFSDLLYQINLRDGQPAYVYLLFDHKSYVDTFVAWQLFAYMKEIWSRSIQTQQEFRKAQRDAGQKPTPLYLPPILPLIIYHGQHNWNVSRDFTALFRHLPKPLHLYTPQFRYWLWDLSDYTADEITGDVLFRVVTLLLKYIHDEELDARLPEIFGLLRELQDKKQALQHLRIILRYLTGGTREFDPQELQHVMNEIFSENDMIPTIWDRWVAVRERKAEQIGLSKGEQIGLSKGLAEGQYLAYMENIKQIIRIRFAVDAASYSPSLAKLRLSQLELLSRDALLVQDIDDFKTHLKRLLHAPEDDERERP